MKKIFAISAGILLGVVVAIGAAHATSYDFNLLGVDKATRVWIYDGKDDDGLTSVSSDWKKNVLFDRGAEILGNSSGGLKINLNLDQDGNRYLRYAIFDGTALTGWGGLVFNNDGSVTQRVRPNLAIGNERVAKWNFGEKVQPSQVPEAGTLVLLGMGLMGVSVFTRRRFKTN